MKILVIGGNGMLGHTLHTALSASHDVRVTLRRPLAEYRPYGLFSADNAYPDIDVRFPGAIAAVLADFRPAAICNAAGIVKQRHLATQAIPSIEVNALFPHRLAAMAAPIGARVVHISTDCVFSGTRGNYTERDRPDPVDLYGRSKLLGELDQEGCITLRTSIIGLELGTRQGLVEWALSQRGAIRGYRRTRFSGLTTHELARVCEAVLTRHVDLEGIWHVASQPISKYDLLVELLRRAGRTDVEVAPDEEVICDRTLCADALNAAMGYTCPDWATMLAELSEAIRDRGRLGET